MRVGKKLFGFTLAETLTALAVLGVVAVICVPAIYKNYTQVMTVSKVKTAYEIIQVALHDAIMENGATGSWKWPDRTASTRDVRNYLFFSDMIYKYMVVASYCDTDNQNCLYGWDGNKELKPGIRTGGFKRLNTEGTARNTDGITTYSADYRKASAVLKNGMVFWIHLGDGKVLTYDEKGILQYYTNGFINVDINGKKGPNQWGYDVFQFPLPSYQYSQPFKGNLYPTWSTAAHYNSRGPANCNKFIEDNVGTSCSEWIIKHGNMDYLKRDVSNEW